MFSNIMAARPLQHIDFIKRESDDVCLRIDYDAVWTVKPQDQSRSAQRPVVLRHDNYCRRLGQSLNCGETEKEKPPRTTLY